MSVPKSTEKYSKVEKSTKKHKKYQKVPKSTKKYQIVQQDAVFRGSDCPTLILML